MAHQVLLVTFFGLLFTAGNAQVLSKIADLSDRVEETSGLIFLDGQLITHNDSGGEDKLYVVDTSSGEVLNDVFINNAHHTDWEDICADETYIYICDSGNNLGNRTNLVIYKVPISDFLDGDASADAEPNPIKFSYGDQTDFEPAQFETNFDAETLISYGDSLLIFSKNWGNGHTRIYPVSKHALHDQVLNPIAEIPVEGLITGGVYNAEKNVIVLTGYENYIPFVIEMQVDGTFDFSSFTWTKSVLNTRGGSLQIEGVSLANNGRYYLSGERTIFSEPTLYSFTPAVVSAFSTVVKSSIEIYPNPASNIVNVKGEKLVRIKLYDITGTLVRDDVGSQLTIGALPRGNYSLQVTTSTGQKESSILVLE